MHSRVPRIFVVDNYDSFTFNLVHLLEQLDVHYEVFRNDAFEVTAIESFSHILISPGPGIPSEAGHTMEVLRTYHHSHRVLGVCLGMQALLESFGNPMENMPQVQHGAESTITQQGGSSVLFRGLPSQFKAGRYHSWAFRPETVSGAFDVTATSEDGYVMAVEHTSLPLYGVQFHPESIMTQYGLDIIRNWVTAPVR